MFKKFTAASIVVGALLVSTMFSTSVSANDQLAQSLCSYTAADNKNQLRKILSDNRLRLRNVYEGVSCGGKNLVRLAIEHNAANAAQFISSQLPVSDLAASGDVQWAVDAGFSSNDAAAAVIKRTQS